MCWTANNATFFTAPHRMCGVVFMCRKNQISAAALIGFGGGLLLGLLLESQLLALLVGGAAICGGFALLRGN